VLASPPQTGFNWKGAICRRVRCKNVKATDFSTMGKIRKLMANKERKGDLKKDTKVVQEDRSYTYQIGKIMRGK